MKQALCTFLGQAAVGGVLGFFLGFATMFAAGIQAEISAWQDALVEAGLAQYCPLDGEWAWLNECVDGKAPPFRRQPIEHFITIGKEP